MSLTRIIKEIGHGCRGAGDLTFEDARRLYGAMLDGGVPELELGSILTALRMKGESLPELLGFGQALSERVYGLEPPAGVRPVVLPSYNGARNEPNLLPLLALWLKRLGVPVLMHGTLEGHGRVASVYILRELGVMPSASLYQAQQALENERFAFVPTAVLSPGLAVLLSLRSRMGVRNSAHVLAKLLDPFEGASLRVVNAGHRGYLEKMREIFLATGSSALLLPGTEGEPFANPRRRPQLEYFHNGEAAVLFAEELGPIRILPGFPRDCDAHTTATWSRQVLAGEAPLPMPLVNQLACCLYGSGLTQELVQAKAIVAVETGSLSPA